MIEGPVDVERVVPSARRTIESLRDIGYSLPQAVADLVDNSISACASIVGVDLDFDGTQSWIRIADNGVGMDSTKLTEALRYGSSREYDDTDLGKFGMGLKTASTSQCRRVSVASRVSARAPIEARCFDMDHIVDTDRWEILVLPPDRRPAPLVEPIQSRAGTVVLWESLDRVLGYKDPYGGWARRRMLTEAEAVANHLSMVFHRFLAGGVPGHPLTITVNGTPLKPWDPFCRDEPHTDTLEPRDHTLTTATGRGGLVHVQPYVLPAKFDFSSQQAWTRASGPLSWNRQQGLYVYRANRLIQSGGWSGLRTLDEHTKLARVAIDFLPSLDDAFGINISKAVVKLPPELTDQIQSDVVEVLAVARARYRQETPPTPRRSTTRTTAPGATTPPPTATPDAGNVPVPENPTPAVLHPTAPAKPHNPRAAMEEAATRSGDTTALRRIIESLQDLYPEVAHELGW